MKRLALALAVLAALTGCATARNGAACWWATTVHRPPPAPPLPPGPLCVESIGMTWQRDGLSCRLVAFPVVGQCPPARRGPWASR